MGWMSWEIFRCNLATPTDNCTDPTTTGCISQALYQGQADASERKFRCREDVFQGATPSLLT